MATWGYAEEQFESKAFGGQNGESKGTVETGIEAEDMKVNKNG